MIRAHQALSVGGQASDCGQGGELPELRHPVEQLLDQFLAEPGGPGREIIGPYLITRLASQKVRYEERVLGEAQEGHRKDLSAARALGSGQSVAGSLWALRLAPVEAAPPAAKSDAPAPESSHEAADAHAAGIIIRRRVARVVVGITIRPVAVAIKPRGIAETKSKPKRPKPKAAKAEPPEARPEPEPAETTKVVAVTSETAKASPRKASPRKAPAAETPAGKAPSSPAATAESAVAAETPASKASAPSPAAAESAVPAAPLGETGNGQAKQHREYHQFSHRTLQPIPIEQPETQGQLANQTVVVDKCLKTLEGRRGKQHQVAEIHHLGGGFRSAWPVLHTSVISFDFSAASQYK